MIDKIVKIIGDKISKELLEYKPTKISKGLLHLPSPTFIEDVLINSDRLNSTLRNLKMLFNSGRLAGTGYLSILPVDQGIEYSAGSSFAKNPIYFDPENMVKLAIESGCNGIVSSVGALGSVARKYVHKIPFIVKLNHNELLSYPNVYDQKIFAAVDQAYDMGAIGVAATVYFGSEESKRQIEEVSQIFEYAHSKGMITMLWAYLRNNQFKNEKADYHYAVDFTSQANYIGSTIKADIVKQKMPIYVKGFQDFKYSVYESETYENLIGTHPIDMVRYQVFNCFSGRVGLMNSGGLSEGEKDIATVIINSIINKRAGGMGLISGRKAFQKPFEEGVKLLNQIQDIYLSKDIDIP